MQGSRAHLYYSRHLECQHQLLQALLSHDHHLVVVIGTSERQIAQCPQNGHDHLRVLVAQLPDQGRDSTKLPTTEKRERRRERERGRERGREGQGERERGGERGREGERGTRRERERGGEGEREREGGEGERGGGGGEKVMCSNQKQLHHAVMTSSLCTREITEEQTFT